MPTQAMTDMSPEYQYKLKLFQAFLPGQIPAPGMLIRITTPDPTCPTPHRRDFLVKRVSTHGDIVVLGWGDPLQREHSGKLGEWVLGHDRLPPDARMELLTDGIRDRVVRFMVDELTSRKLSTQRILEKIQENLDFVRQDAIAPGRRRR